MGADDDLIVQRELGKLAELELLEDGEILCEVEEAWRRFGWGRGRIGALVLTDLRVLFVSTWPPWRRRRFESFALADIDTVDLFVSPVWEERGALALATRDEHQQATRVEFERIEGGHGRAEEIANSVLRQKTFLERRVPEETRAPLEPADAGP